MYSNRTLLVKLAGFASMGPAKISDDAMAETIAESRKAGIKRVLARKVHDVG